MIVALAGGVGGAKLAFGLQATLAREELLIVVNTGDDFEHLGFYICPDLDTVTYTLAGCANPETGWGIAGETWHCLSALSALGTETWFQLGDNDLATHIERSRRLREGATLTQVSTWLAKQRGVRAEIIPMTDDPVRTIVRTDIGALAFQDYFVRRRCEPTVVGIEFCGAKEARPHPRFLQALVSRSLRAVIICPSNPYLSIAPMLSLPGIRSALEQISVPVIAISPLVGGRALKGPTAKIMRELGVSPSPVGIAAHYAPFLDALVIDHVDEPNKPHARATLVTNTVMKNDQDRIRLAKEVVRFAHRL